MCAGKLIFVLGKSSTVEVQKCQDGVCGFDCDLENEVKVRRSRNVDWLYIEHFSTENQNVECCEIGSMALRHVSKKI